MSPQMPEFFIVGAPKCGTTSLYAYLSRHPAVFMPRVKEPFFFCSDIQTTSMVRSLDDYCALFALAPLGSMRGEASTLYLFSEVAIPRIMALRPDAKILVMLRNPSDAAYSFHQQR